MTKRSRAAAATVWLVLAAAPAMAQDPLIPVDQISVPAPGVMPQLSQPGTPPVIAAPPPAPRTVSATQLAPQTSRQPGASQLTSANISKDGPVQVSSGERTAEQPAPLSKPSDGRIAAVERVHGDDRCDPAQRNRSSAQKCAQVIENRAAEFSAREAPALSPEQRILADQQRRAEALDVRSAARRLATEGTAADDPELQGIASVVLRAPPPPARNDKPEENRALDAAAAIVNAVMGGGTAGAPPQP